MSKEIFERIADEGAVDASRLLKEDDILNEEDKIKPDNSCEPASSSSKPKKPCANCTCGLADELNTTNSTVKEDNTSVDTQKKTGSCGSCYLGDAFRCASCPYRGMPAFKPGETVTIDTLADDL